MASKPPHTRKPVKKPASGRSRPPRKSGKGGARFGWRLPLIFLGAAILLTGLILLARRDERLPSVPVERPAEVRIDQAVSAREQVEAFLASTEVSAGSITREPADLPRHYQVHHRPPAAAAVEKLRQRLHRLVPPLILTAPEDGVLTIIDGQGKSLLTIQYLQVPPIRKEVPLIPGKVGRVVIIVDDLGRGIKQAKQLLALPQPVTFSILPGEPHAGEVARMAHAAGREVLLHVPMEPQGFPVVDPGDDALLVGHSDAEIRTRFTELLAKVPSAVGTNNHMGSRFTEDGRAMAIVMEVLRERRLFFVDSLTSSHSVGTLTAHQAGVSLLRRDIFLDNVAEFEPIVRELQRLAEKAGRNGSVLGICHPYPETIRALQQELPRLAAQGIKFVTVAELLRGGQ